MIAFTVVTRARRDVLATTLRYIAVGADTHGSRRLKNAGMLAKAAAIANHASDAHADATRAARITLAD